MAVRAALPDDAGPVADSATDAMPMGCIDISDVRETVPASSLKVKPTILVPRVPSDVRTGLGGGPVLAGNTIVVVGDPPLPARESNQNRPDHPQQD